MIDLFNVGIKTVVLIIIKCDSLKTKSNNMVVNDAKICQKMKNKSLLSIEKNSIK